MNTAQHPPILSTSAADLLRLGSFNRIFRGARLIWCGSAAAVAMFLSPAPVKAATDIWYGNGADANWQTAGNFSTAPTTGDDLVFQGSNKLINYNDTNPAFSNFNSITFTQTAGKFQLLGGAVLLTGALTNFSTATQTISFADAGGGFGGLITFNGTSINAINGNIIVNSNITFADSNPLTINGPHDVVINGGINDSGLPPFDAALVKNGTGTLTLNGRSTFPGDTIINGGTIYVDGSTASLRTFVNQLGTLAGNGYVGGTVFNNGNVAPGNGMAPGTLGIGGDYVQNRGSTLTIGVEDGKASALSVAGTAYLGGKLRLTDFGKDGGRLRPGQKETIIYAADGVNGRFKSVGNANPDTIQTMDVVYSSNKVVLEGMKDYFSVFAHGLTPNQRATAAGLDQVAFRNTQPKLINFLDSEPVSRLPSDFDRLAPEELSSIFNIGISLANIQTANLQRRTDDIRMGSHGFSAAGFAAAGSGPLYSGGFGSAGPNGNDGKDVKDMKTVAPAEDRWGVFITGTGEWVNVDGDNNARGYDITTGGFTVGADYKVTPNFAVGVSAGYAGTSSDLTDGGRIYVNGGKLGLYSTYFTGGFYVDAAVNGGYNSYDTRRSAIDGTARGDTDGGELNVLIGTGYQWKVGNFSFGPTASFQYTYLGIGSYDETGSLAPLSIASQHQESLRTSLGMKASYDCKVGTVLVRPELSLAWQHEYGDVAYALDSSFADTPSSLFTVNGPKLGRDSLLVGAGFAILWNERTSTYFYYDGELARTNYESNAVSGGVRVSF